jgi:anti-sigma factor RsiW
MNEKHCEQRDDYLLDELESDQRAQFEQHLSSCDSCRRFVEAQARINRILKEAANSVEVRVQLSAHIESKLVVARRRQRTKVATLVALPIVAGLFAVIYFAIQQQHQPDRQEQIVQDFPPAEQEPNTAVEQIVPESQSGPVEVEVSGDVLAMQIESGDPNVTLIQVFQVKQFEHGKLK